MSSASRKRVFLYKNEATMTSTTQSKVLVFDSDADDVTITMNSLKKMISDKLQITAKRIFLSSGAEVVSEDMIVNDDNLYISQGEPFYRSSSSLNNEKMDIAILGEAGSVVRVCILIVLYCSVA